jgi:polyhydroxybutyrate depolymerase
MSIRLAALVTLLALAAVLLTGCERARERREARQAAADATATVEAMHDGPASSPLDATPSGGEGDTQASTPESSAPPPASPSCEGVSLSWAPGSTIETLTSSGVERHYRLYVPSSYDASGPLPLVLNFHGFGSNAVEQERYSEVIDVAERHGFIAATPDGTNSPQRWYIYGQLEPGYVDDFDFVDALIDDLMEEYCIDQSRVYAMGISNGGGMTSLLGCRLNSRFAAIAPVAGSPYSSLVCNGAGPMPIVAFHGTDDDLVPFEGGPGGRLGLPINAVRDNMLGWAQHNSCSLDLQTQRIADDVVLESYTGCNAGADVHLYVIESGGHTWPGSSRNIAVLGSTTQSISATEVAWQFFAAHAK